MVGAFSYLRSAWAGTDMSASILRDSISNLAGLSRTYAGSLPGFSKPTSLAGSMGLFYIKI